MSAFPLPLSAPNRIAPFAHVGSPAFRKQRFGSGENAAKRQNVQNAQRPLRHLSFTPPNDLSRRMFNPVSPTVTLNPFSVFFETLPPSLESSSPTPGAGSSSMASLAAMAAASSAGLSPSSLCSVMLSDDLSSLTSSTSLERLHTSPMHKSRLPSSASSSSFPDLAFLTQSSSSPSLPASGRTPYASMDLSMSTPVQLASNTYGTYGTLSSGALPASMSFPFTPDGASTPNAMERAVEAAMLARPRHVRQQSGTPQAFSGVAMVCGETPTHRRVPSPSTASMSDISSALSSNTESSRFAFTQRAPEVHRSPHQHQVRVGVASAVSYDDDSSMTDTSPLAAAAAAAAAHKSRRTRNLKILPPPATPIAQLPASDAGPMLVPMHQLNEVVVQQHQLAKAEFQQRRQERRRMKRSASRELHRDTVSPVAAQAPVAAPQPVLCPDAHHTHPTSMEVDDSDEPASPDNGPKRRRRSRSASSSDDSDFICTRPGCGKSFSSRYSLRRHQKQHTGERPHACPFDGCTRRFAERSTLIRHVRVHTGEKPFECPHPGCTRRFSDRTNVKRHALTHNGGRPYPCPHAGCNKAYTRRCYLNKHLSTAHGDE